MKPAGPGKEVVVSFECFQIQMTVVSNPIFGEGVAEAQNVETCAQIAALGDAYGRLQT